MHGGGKLGLEAADFELIAVRGVAGPLTIKLKRLAALYAREWTEDGNGALAVGDADLGHAIGILFVEENDPFEDACDGFV